MTKLSYPRTILRLAGLAVAITVACAKDPWTVPDRAVKSVGSEIFRVFCKREVGSAFPADLEGWSFDPACNGEGTPPATTPRLQAMLQRRAGITTTLDRILGDDGVAQPEGVQVLDDGELQTFLTDIVPLYDLPEETLPEASRTLAAVLARLIDPDDTTGRAALQALSEITGRRGYRRAELALGLLRPLLEYPDLDTFAELGLKAIATGGVAEAALDQMSLGLALEMASYDPAPPAPDSTLLIARDLLLSHPDELVAGIRSQNGLDPVAEAVPPSVAPVSITKRNAHGVAVPLAVQNGGAVLPPFVDQDGDGQADVDSAGRFVSADGSPVPTPFAVAGDDGSTPRDAQGRALDATGNQPLFADFDAQPTFAALLLRETPRLSVPQAGETRTTLEKLGRGLAALFGTPKSHGVQYGNAAITFEGPDPATGAFHDLVHAAAQLAKNNPEVVQRFLTMFTTAMVAHENEMAAFVDMVLRVKDRADGHDEAELQGLNGPGTSLFWDHLIEIGKRMTDRPGLVEAVVRTIQTPEMEQLGQVVADWMQYVDRAPYVGADMTPMGDQGTWTGDQATNLNTPVTVQYQMPVDYSQPSVGPNRSVWQQTMSMVHNLRNQGICNPDGTTFHLPLAAADQGIGLDDVPSLLGVSWGIYSKCQVYDIQDMVRIWMQSILGKAVIVLGDAPDLVVFQVTGTLDPYAVMQRESQIKGFGKNPTPESFARFLYGPPNEFVDGISDPVMKDGFPVTEIDPYALFAMEVPHASAGGASFLQAGKPLIEAFESHELVEPAGDGSGTTRLTDSNLFADFLDVFHMHWSSQTDAPCPGDYGAQCTQRVDPSAPLFSYQSNLRSYEPLLAEMLREDHIIPVLRDATNAWESVTVDGKNGVEIFAELVETLLKPDDGLAYRDGRTTALDNMGQEVGYVSPLYLLLDGLAAIDRNFEDPSYASAHDTWLEARSEIADLYLSTETVDGQMRLADRMGHAFFITALDFLQDRLKAHTDAGDLEAWADGLASRSVTFFDTPLVAGLLQLFQKSWDEPDSGRELMRFITYMVDEANDPVGFETTLVAFADLLQLLEDAPRIAPLMDLAAEAVVPGVPKAVEQNGPLDFDVRKGILRVLVELQNDLLKLHKRRPSTLSRVARNLVGTHEGDLQTPLEALIDDISEVERQDPTLPTDEPLTAADLEAIARSAHEFIRDDGHGMERLYDVIQNRAVAGSSASDTDGADTPDAAAPMPTPSPDAGAPNPMPTDASAPQTADAAVPPAADAAPTSPQP